MWLTIYEHLDNKIVMYGNISDNTFIKNKLISIRKNLAIGNLKDGISLLKTIFSHQFRLYDDDGIWCITGYMDNECLHSNEVFDILDFGLVSDGCTMLKYEENGKFHLL